MTDPMSSFEVRKIFPIEILGLDFSLTNSSLFMLLSVLLISLFFFVATKEGRIVPSKIQAIAEYIFFFVGSLVKANSSRGAINIFPYILSIFLFISLGNVIGLVPFAFSFTSQLVITVSMALLVFIASIVIGFKTSGISYLKHFCPSGLPLYLMPFFIIIELMSFLFRPISLGVRLFANMVAGHIMIKVIAGFAVSIAGVAAFSYFAFIPVVVNIFLNIFKLIVCLLQAYVFAVLSCIYISESMTDLKSDH